MNKSFINRITFRVWFPYVSFITFLAVVLLIYFPSRQEQLLKQFELQELQSLVNATALGVSISLEIDDYSGVESTIDYISKKEEILFAAIILTDNGEQTVLTSYPRFLNISAIEELQNDAIFKEQKLDTSELEGIIRIAVSNEILKARIYEINRPVYVIVFIVFLIMMIVSYSIAKKYSEPIKSVESYASKLGRGEFRSQVEIDTDIHEIQSLVSVLENLSGTLERQKQAEKEFANELENQIKNRTAELNNALEAKDEFLATMSHEIRTPLNSIIGFSDLLKERITDGKNGKMIESLNYSSKHLLSLINAILDFSKLSSQSLELQKDEFSLKEVIHQIKDQFEPIVNEKNIEFNVSIDNDIADRYCCDKVRINQLLYNLLSNAIKFTENGFVELGITLISEESDVHNLLFEIKDTGIGIKETDLWKIQQPFIQASQKITNSFGGTGLGLSIVNKLLHLFNSKLEINSKFGAGSVFSFELSLIKVKIDAVEIEANDGNSLSDNEPLRVLYVDDMKMNLYVFEEVVRDMNIQLDTCESAKEAYKYCDQFSYDLILLDIRMPEIDGVDAFNHIKLNSRKNWKTPIAAFTANVELLHSKKYLGMGFCSHLSKPITPGKIRKLLNNVRNNEITS